MNAMQWFGLATVTLTLPLQATAAACDNVMPEEAKVVKVDDPNKINTILKGIPFNDKDMPYKHIGERFPKLGMKVERVVYGKVTMEEVCSSGGAIKKGDVMYQFSTSEPHEGITRQYCQISSRYVLLKRGKKWLAYDRTGNFLMNNKCAAPSSSVF